MRAALYARVSTSRQDLDGQLEELRRFAAARGMTIVGEYGDVISGAKKKRPQLEVLLDVVRHRAVDVVVATHLDRLGRNTRHLLEISDVLKDSAVDLVIVRQAIDTTTAVGKLTYVILAALGEFHLGVLRERVTEGVRRARARRHRWGPLPKRVVDVARAQALKESGASLRAIARELGVHPTAVSRALRRVSQYPAPDLPPKSAV
ncbi:MAG: recombinase family protein [Candidatus Rokuibacteriota bacterium]